MQVCTSPFPTRPLSATAPVSDTPRPPPPLAVPVPTGGPMADGRLGCGRGPVPTRADPTSHGPPSGAEPVRGG